jgi:hypothetical protein
MGLIVTTESAPGNAGSGTVHVYSDSVGLGTPAAPALMAVDQNGNQLMIGHLTILDYRLIGIRILTSGTSYVPTNGVRAIYVECVGGGGQGGGAATSSSTCSLGGGGGGGAYAAKWITGAGVKNPTTYAIGVGGSSGTAGNSGQAGGDTTWDTGPAITAKGGSGGAVLAAGTSNVMQVGAAGGAQGSCVGDLTLGGEPGGMGQRTSGTAYLYAGNGGCGIFGGAGGIGAVNSATGATGASAGLYGAGGAGAATLATAAAGGAGSQGFIRVWEFS